MRLFTAIDPPPEILQNLYQLQERLKPTARIKWSPLANLHITTKFIGEWPEPRLPELTLALRTLPAMAPISIHIRNLGFYPQPHHPHVFWAGIEAPEEFTDLARQTDQATAALGIEREKKPYTPHLTLARIKEPVPLQKLRETIAALPSLDFGSFTADRFHLYQSRLEPKGSVYTKLSEFQLSK